MLRLVSTLALATLLCGRAAAQNCNGCTPLNDLGTGLYKGAYQGGLYAGGSNVPPPALQLAAIYQNTQVVPRDAAGAPSPHGFIGLVSITMSNANQEFSAFERRADLDTTRNARVRVLNLAQGGQALDIIDDPAAPYWTAVNQRVAASGLSPQQVQVAWLKMADIQPMASFPQHAFDERDHARTVLQILRGKFPNLRLAFFSSRIYGGYSGGGNLGEPISYETGFAVKWLIELQQSGDPGLNWDPGAGPVMAPLVMWGPYLWANGTIPRSDGLVWLASDFETDKIHPSPAGEQKVADLLEDFFTMDPAAPWYAAASPGYQLVTLDALADAYVDSTQPTTNFGAFPDLLAEQNHRTFVKFDLSGVTGKVLGAKLSLIVPPNGGTGNNTQARSVSDSSWTELGITDANAPTIDGALIGTLPALSRGAATSYGVTADVAGVHGLRSFAFASNAAQLPPQGFMSREAAEPPRLVLTVCPQCADPVTYCTAKTNSCGTLPAISFTGFSSAALTSGFVVQGSAVNFAKSGLVIYSNAGRNNAPFQGGTLCVATPVRRSVVSTATGGAAGTCTSVIALDLNAFAAGHLGGTPAAYLRTPGQQVNVQWWARDTLANGSYLTDGGEYVVGP